MYVCMYRLCMKVSRDVECSLGKDLEGFALLIWKRSVCGVLEAHGPFAEQLHRLCLARPFLGLGDALP